mgnify:FL=1
MSAEPKQSEYMTLLMHLDDDQDDELGGNRNAAISTDNTVTAADGALVADASEITTRDLLGFFLFGLLNNTRCVCVCDLEL